MLIRRKLGLRRFKNISYTSNCINEACREVFFQFVSQSAYQYVYHIGLGIEIIIPDLFKNRLFSDDFIRVAHKKIQKNKFTFLKIQFTTCANDFTIQPIEFQILKGQPESLQRSFVTASANSLRESEAQPWQKAWSDSRPPHAQNPSIDHPAHEEH